MEQWYDRAACRGDDVEAFYTELPEQTARALAICATCPVRARCLQVAMEQREMFGVWGGTAGPERRRIFRREDRRRQRAARAA